MRSQSVSWTSMGAGVCVFVFLYSSALIPEHVVYTTLGDSGLSLFGIPALLSVKQLKSCIPKQTP